MHGFTHDLFNCFVSIAEEELKKEHVNVKFIKSELQRTKITVEKLEELMVKYRKDVPEQVAEIIDEYIIEKGKEDC